MARRWRDSCAPLLRDVFARVSGAAGGQLGADVCPGSAAAARRSRDTLLIEVVELLVSIVVERIEANTKPAAMGGRARRYQYFASNRRGAHRRQRRHARSSDPRVPGREGQGTQARTRHGCSDARTSLRATADYDAWSSARDALTWIGSFLSLFWLHAEDATGVDTVATRRLSEEAWTALKSHPSSEPDYDITGLYSLGDRVKTAVAERIAAKTVEGPTTR